MKERIFLVGLAVLSFLLAGACTEAEPDEQVQATVPPSEPETGDPSQSEEVQVREEPAEPPPTTNVETDPSSLYAIPDEIDEDYVNRVLEALAAVDGHARRLIVEAKEYTGEADETLAAIYDSERLEEQRDIWAHILTQDEQLTAFTAEPGDQEWAVIELIHADPKCLFVHVSIDRNPVAVDPQGDHFSYFRLEPLTQSEVAALNPTSWVVTRRGNPQDAVAAEVPNLCA